MKQAPHWLVYVAAAILMAGGSAAGGWLGARAGHGQAAPGAVLHASRQVVTLYVDHAEVLPDSGLEAQPHTVRRVASGFAFAPGGWLITNAHAVAGARRIEARLPGGDRVAARVHGVASRLDLAVVRLLEAAAEPLQQGAPARIGDAVWAVGAPFELHGSISTGVVSGLDRAYDALDPNAYIQHDAAINPGSSGGPLLDASGRVVGVNTAVARPAMTNVGVSFAIPAELAFSTAEQIRRGALPEPPFLGVRVRAREGDGGEGRGLHVEAVMGRSAADAAGLRPGDVLLAFNQIRLAEPRDLDLALIESSPGEQVSLTWVRGGVRQEAYVALPASAPPHRPRTAAAGSDQIAGGWSGAAGGPY